MTDSYNEVKVVENKKIVQEIEEEERKEKELERSVGFGRKEKLTWCTNGPIFPSCDKRHLNIQTDH